MQVETERGAADYGIRLERLQGSERWQWLLCLERINGIEIGDSRGWLRVGPIFEKRAEGGRWLGTEEPAHRNVEKHIKQIVAEYEESYADDPIGWKDGRKFPRMGRPSQGRTERLQFTTTPQVLKWLEGQSQEGETLSQTIHRVLVSTSEK